MMAREEALKEARIQKVMSGGEYNIIGKNGYWYKDGKKIEDIDTFLETVSVDEEYVLELMNK